MRQTKGTHTNDGRQKQAIRYTKNDVTYEKAKQIRMEALKHAKIDNNDVDNDDMKKCNKKKLIKTLGIFRRLGSLIK